MDVSIDRLLDDLGDIPFTTEPALVRQKSMDFFWYSPVLKQSLRGKTADAVVSPRNEADVVRVAAAAYRARVPITARRQRNRQLWASGAARRRHCA